MRACALRLIVGLLFVGSLGSAHAATQPASAPRTVGAQTLAAQVVDEVNRVRLAHGLRPLRRSTGLTACARAHTLAMARRGVFAHELPGEPRFSTRVRRHYRPRNGRWSAGENLAAQTAPLSARDAVRMWLESPGHRQNLLSRRWREIGVAAVFAPAAPGDFGGADMTLVTATFGVR
jgi:uncharacterized protein YkwD